MSVLVNPKSNLIDEDNNIKVTSLQPKQKITTYSSTSTDTGDLFECFAFYRANDEGLVDLSKDPSHGGMFYGVEPMGLFWAMKASSQNDRRFSRMVKKDVTSPMIVNICLYESWIDLEAIKTTSPFACDIVEKWFKHKDVKREPIRVGQIRGTLFTPPGDGPFKSVIDMFGGAGGLFEFRASMLASRGFLTLALAISYYEDLPELDFIDLNYFEDAVMFLQGHSKSQKGGIGVMGVSLGADIALAMGAYIPGVNCNICINGTTYAFHQPMKFRGYTIKTLDIDYSLANYIEPDVIVFKDIFKIPKDSDEQSSMIEYPKSKVSTLFLGSEKDEAFNMMFIHKRANKILKQRKGGNGSYKFIMYPGAGHLLELPNTALGKIVYLSRVELFQYYGGETLQHERAQKSSWNEILNFFKKNIIPFPKSAL